MAPIKFSAREHLLWKDAHPTHLKITLEENRYVLWLRDNPALHLLY